MSYSPVEPRRHRLSVDDYYRMGEVGILAPDARVELIDGEIIDMAPIGSPHVSIVAHLDYVFQAAVRGQALVLVQAPIVLDDYSAPQPDLVLLRPRADFYRSGLARPADIYLIVEVAQSSLRYDRGVKVPLYARHEIPETWVIDAGQSKLTRYRVPAQAAYSVVDEPSLAAPLGVDLLPGVALDLRSVLLRAGD